MKVKIGPYRYRWVSYVHDHYMDKKYGRWEWDESTTRFEKFLERVEDALQWIYNHSINLIIDNIPGQKIRVHVDDYDVWSMDHTLAYIVVPMLKKLKEKKHGAPFVDNADVPKELRMSKKELDAFNNDGTNDDKFFKRWDWVMDEMIWAFEQKTYDWEEQYYGEWQPSEDKPLGGFFLNPNDEGRKQHQERMSNGFRLFGKYYEALWD